MLEINISKLTYSFSENKKPIISDLSANFKSGDRVLILGKNGSGKSTLLQLIAGLINSKSIYFKGFKDFKAPICGYLSHNLNLYKELNANEHFEFFSKLIFKNLDQKIVFNELIEKFNLNKKIKLPVSELSKGEKVKLSLILKLFYKPKVLLLDEPETALDKESRDTLLAELNDLSLFYKDENIIVVVSHSDLFDGWFNTKIELS